MRILLVTPDYPPPPGGIQTLTRGLEVGLDRCGHSVAVVESVPKLFAQTYLSTRPSLSLTDLGRLKHLLHYPYLNHCYRRVADRIETFDPDVVHVLHVDNWPGLLAARRAAVPTVVTAHGLELREQRSTRHAIELATSVHAVSEFTADLVADVTNRSCETIAVIPPGIDVETYRKTTQARVSADGPVVTIARMVSRKNLRTLLEGWREVDQTIRGDCSLIVVGDGPQRDSLESEFSGDQVTFTGWISETEKRSLLDRAALFTLVPRRSGFDVEGFGIVFIEAQAAGVPVVGSQTGGVPEAVGEGGLLVEDESDSGEVADAIEILLSDSAVRQDVLESIEARIGQFDLEPIAQKHLMNYSSLVES